MKKISLLLAASVLGNLALIALILTGSTGKSTPATDASGSPSAGQTSSATVAKPSGIDVKDIDPATWTHLGGDDLPSLVARLREAGFPPSLVRSIVAAQISERYAARRKELSPPKSDLPFWQVDQPRDPKVLAALRELSREQSKEMKELLGSAAMPIDDPMYAAMLRRQYGDLPQEKIDQITRVIQDYGELRNDIYTAAGIGGGSLTLLPEEREKIALLEKEQRKDIAQLFTPQEFEDYELRSSNTANRMRSTLSAFKPTEEEFRAIFKLQSQFDETYSGSAMSAAITTPGPAQQEFMRQRTEAQKQLTAQVAGMLGEGRGAEYERAVDNSFQQVNRVVERLELPATAAVEVWNTQKEIEQRSAALRNDRTMSPADRTAQLTALAREANAKVTAALGQRGYDVYKQNGGFWIQNLEQQAARPAAGPAAVQGGGGGGSGGQIIRISP